ncbi:hypothetical protein GJ496_000484 [Pomphorhynchus laevis]|nr:hypothetical protein GJ496_000484 [Pomphorhynchus laevis]
MLGLQDMRLFGNPITEIPSGFLNLSSQLKSFSITLNHLQCPNINGIFNQIEEIRFSGCAINIKDYFGLDKLTYIELESTVFTDWVSLHGTTGATIINLSFNRIVKITKAQLPETYNLKSLDLRGNGIQLISDFVYLLNKSTDYLNIIQNYNPTERQFSDYLDNLLALEFVYTDYNINLLMLDLINSSGLPQILCLHSMCIPGKHIERVAIKQSIGNPYGYTCPTMFSKHNEFKYLKIDRIMSITELLAKHIFPCVEYIEIFDNGDVDHIYILTIICYNVKRLDLSFNRITEFNKLYDILLNTKLQILNMSFNDIEYLKDVNDNTSIILSNSILEVLDLSNNKLTLLTIQWVLTPSLRVLNCSYNQIRNVYFSGFLLYGNASQLSILNLANNRDLTFEQNIFDSLTGLTEIDLSATNLPSDSLPENAATFCKFDLRGNSQIRRINVITESICQYRLQVHITSLCGITTRNCPYSSEQLKRDALERRFQGTNDFVDSRQIKCSRLHIIADSWSCEDYNKIFLNLECI